ncbi:hypothetical protein FSP39_002432 [Pinctada imbricata]|uniref:DUF4097 domain-containing protein n=1 Tax=Pinctada imbricata TaxID=66713 RepID=A0AA88YGG1_PINIB|nr:hypothetical protein FSP39_002432 [Pinctada imbricata]
MTSTHDKLLEAHFFGVETYGKLDVTTPFDVVIEPLDEQKYPEMNKCFIKLFYDSEAEDNLDCLTLDSIKNLYEFKVNKKDRKAITIEAKYKTSVEVPVLCKIQAPLKFDLHVIGESKNVQISKMECSTISVDLDDNKSDSETGQKKTSSCTLNSIKVIKCDRVQAQTVSMTTELGNISATSVYVPQSSFSSDYGDIDLNNCHSNCTVKINQGNLKIGSFEGNLDADLHTGSVDIYMTRPKEVKVTTQSGKPDHQK